ncbi:hypothetical protein Zmor_026963 [Zophobas morio]|uniref:Uncharacterized protein n=1 Tax=Zophobas morio TaxID=2755281 RepID=A0AA38HW71_9CUCU|nr:hypothetical protein Zmor_026963 [Zophobas morio]
MKQKSKLKGTEIFIDDDYTKRENEIQKKIRAIGAGEKRKRRETKVGYKKLIRAGEVWQWNEDQDEFVKKPLRPKENSKNE